MTIANNVNYRDTYGFFQESLDALSSNMTAEEKERVKGDMHRFLNTFPTFAQKYRNLTEPQREEDLAISLKKGCIPYEYLTDVSVMAMKTLPTEKCFISTLKVSAMGVDPVAYSNTKIIFDYLCDDLGDLVEWCVDKLFLFSFSFLLQRVVV